MTLIGTHSGSFHADEVFAIALLKTFAFPNAEWVRSRDSQTLSTCDAVVDVGGRYDPETLRFDHHQNDYTGDRSSAGLVLDWLETQAKVSPKLALTLRKRFTDHIDAVDTGRSQPTPNIPCLSAMVATLSSGAGGDFDAAFAHALTFCEHVIAAGRQAFNEAEAAQKTVRAAMAHAKKKGMRTLFFDAYVRWKPAYFKYSGGAHPTDFIAFPEGDRWRLVCIPIKSGSFENKKDLPAEWAGLTDAALEAAMGVSGAVFCHKNRFIAAFKTREALCEALVKWQLDPKIATP